MTETPLEAAHRDRRRAVKVANERARNNATMITQLGAAVVIAGMIAPAFSDTLDFSPQGIAFTALITGLLFTVANLILSTIDLED